MHRFVLRASQLIQQLHLIPCATASHFSGVAFAMAKASQFQQVGRVAPTTRRSSGQQNASAFCSLRFAPADRLARR